MPTLTLSDTEIPPKAEERDESPVSQEDMIPVLSSHEYWNTITIPSDGEPHGSCDSCGVEYTSEDERDEHTRKYHPLQCSDCDGMAAYTRKPPGRSSPWRYCAYHAHQSLDADYSLRRIERPANAAAPRLPDDHPIEVVLSGLGADI